MGKEKFRFRKRRISGIPVLECFPANAGGKKLPLVIMLHGFTRSKEFWKKEMEKYAGLGYYTAAPDNRECGQRRSFRFYLKVLKGFKVNMAELVRLFKESADDCKNLIGHYVNENNIDNERIGVTGFSMGGYIAFRLLVIDSRVKAASPMIASPYWDDLPCDRRMSDAPGIIKKLKAYSEMYNPALFPERIFPRPVLMQIGACDVHFKVKKVENFYENLKSYYNDVPERVELLVYENVAHEITPAMLEKTSEWFMKWL